MLRWAGTSRHPSGLATVASTIRAPSLLSRGISRAPRPANSERRLDLCRMPARRALSVHASRATTGRPELVRHRRKGMMLRVVRLTLLAGCVTLAGATHTIANSGPNFVQIVALDECDPDTFNAALGEGGTGFCHNVALRGLGFGDEVDELFRKAAAGTPDPSWDFEPDQVTIRKDTILSVVDQGGEPHTFTEVSRFGGGFVKDLNHGETTVPECDGGFANVAVARTRIVQGSHLDITGLSKGKHLFQCCIHPWMRMEVDVK